MLTPPKHLSIPPPPAQFQIPRNNPARNGHGLQQLEPVRI